MTGNEVDSWPLRSGSGTVLQVSNQGAGGEIFVHWGLELGLGLRTG